MAAESGNLNALAYLGKVCTFIFVIKFFNIQ